MSQPRDARFLASLAGNLSDFAVNEVDEGLGYLLEQAGLAFGAENCNLAICVRDGKGSSALSGWRPVWDTRGGPDLRAHDEVFDAWYGDIRNHPADAMVVRLAQTRGVTRAFRRRDVVDEETWRRSPVQELFDALAVGDRLVTAMPVDSSTEIILTNYRRASERPFAVEDVELAEHIAMAAGYFCKRLVRSLGFGEGKERLTPRERTVLLALLGGQAEKEIARDIGLTSRSLHQNVVAVYRKLGVSSRPGLMARFMAAGDSWPEAVVNDRRYRKA